ncbi:MAG: hypothetical protein SFY81_03405 [Verrucomicrobiota bacterium]|nr:hypothetical protein [Verrucomicrobiota bacterium]
MKATLEVIEKMRADGIIGNYAIGGAVGATVYLEPLATFDIDIFISFKKVQPGLLVSLSPIYEYLQAKGYQSVEEHIMIEGWKVQFLPTHDALLDEALSAAVRVSIYDAETWVMTAEHLMAIALKLGRPKDYNRIDQFISEEAFDETYLMPILQRHGLIEKWNAHRQKIL